MFKVLFPTTNQAFMHLKINFQMAIINVLAPEVNFDNKVKYKKYISGKAKELRNLRGEAWKKYVDNKLTQIGSITEF